MQGPLGIAIDTYTPHSPVFRLTPAWLSWLYGEVMRGRVLQGYVCMYVCMYESVYKRGYDEQTLPNIGSQGRESTKNGCNARFA